MESTQLDPEELELERFIAIGRLASVFVHEVGNHMQVIRGALTLAQEDQDDREALAHYLAMSLQESEHVVELVTLLREVYRPPSGQAEASELGQLLAMVRSLAQPEAIRRDVTLTVALAPGLPPAYGSRAHISLSLLNMTLVLIALAHPPETWNLTLAAHSIPAQAPVKTSATSEPAAPQLQLLFQLQPAGAPLPAMDAAPLPPALLRANEIVCGQDGSLQFFRHANGARLIVCLPTPPL